MDEPVRVGSLRQTSNFYGAAWRFVLLCTCLTLGSSLMAQDWVKIGTSLGVEKVRLAVPDFKPSTNDPGNAALLKTFDDTLWNDLDVSGVVEKVGSKITKFKAGDPVFAYVSLDSGGGYAQYAVVPERDAVPKPKSLSYVEAAAVPIVALTAWQALIETAKLDAGQTVLIHGGSGGVGSFAVQIAKARGARVIATASTANQDLLKQLGTDEAVDYTKQKFEDVARDVDVVLDSIGKDTLARSYGVVKKGGIIVSLVARPNQSELEKHGIRGVALSVEPNSEELAEIANCWTKGKSK